MRHLPILVCALSALVVAMPSPASAAHGADKNCSAFSTQAAAQSHMNAHPGDPDGLDGDRDGEACESLPCPCEITGTPSQPPEQPRISRARVVRVIDGDTLTVRLTTGRTATVRLIGIDTPETRKPGTPVECGGRDATAQMRRLALSRGRGRMVTLTSDPTQSATDRYGRLLAYVGSAGGDFGLAMISSGGAMTYVFERDFQRVAQYRRAQASAKAADRGVWRACAGDFHRAR